MANQRPKRRGAINPDRLAASPGAQTTKPRPFVFVLMPFDKGFSDIYAFGIREAAKKAGAYAERLDGQMFTEGMLERVFNQISKADVIVADMTGQRANVFYEVGYAHALGKVVLLLTQNANDIPFDLRHQYHVEYDGTASDLQRKLAPRLKWAVGEARVQRGKQLVAGVSVWAGTAVLSTSPDGKLFEFTGDFKGKSTNISVSLLVRNDSEDSLTDVTHVYLFTEDTPAIAPTEPHYYDTDDSLLGGMLGNSRPRLRRSSFPWAIDGHLSVGEDAKHGLVKQFRLPQHFAAIPPGATEDMKLDFKLSTEHRGYSGPMRLRIHTKAGPADFYFRMNVRYDKEEPEAATPSSGDGIPKG